MSKRIVCEKEGAAVVIRGSLNPGIFHPSWMVRHELIDDAQADAAQIELVKSEISMFTVEPFSFLVQPESFQVFTQSMDAGKEMRDMAAAIFTILGETPVTAMGMNRYMHFKMPSESEWHSFGHKLVPKELWGGLLEEPKTNSVQVQGNRPGTPASSCLNVKVEPSKKVQPGVYVEFNEHHSLRSDEEDRPIESLVRVLLSEWDELQSFSRTSGEALISKCLGT